MTSGVWLYPHDVHDLPELAPQLRDAGIDTVCLAGSYHSLLAAAPGNPMRRIFELPGSAVYFQPDEALWDGRPLRPRVAPMVAERGDAFTAGRALADRVGATLTGWLVCLHDDKLVRDRPELAVETAAGDRLPGAPCLLAPDVRDYAVRLVQDAARRVDSVQLESLHWLGQPHARHAKAGGAAPRLTSLVLSVCFCTRCRIHAAGLAVDADQVAAALLAAWAAAWDGLAPDDPALVAGLDGYLRTRSEVVTELLAEVAGSTSVPLEMVQFGDSTLHGVDTRAIEADGVAVRVLAYGPSQRVGEVLTGYQNAWTRPRALHIGLSVLPEHVADLADAQRAVRLAGEAGARSVRFYHFGLAGPRRRSWLPRLIQDWQAARRLEVR